MPPAASDRALKRLVADLAAQRAEDVEAVLDQLDARQREKVQAMLASYLGPIEPPVDPEPVNVRRTIDYAKIDGLSPWLAARLHRSQSAGETPRKASWLPRRADPYERDAGRISMTTAALAELHDCAERQFAAQWPELTAPRPWAQALVTRIRDALGGVRAPS